MARRQSGTDDSQVWSTLVTPAQRKLFDAINADLWVACGGLDPLSLPDASDTDCQVDGTVWCDGVIVAPSAWGFEVTE